MKIMNCIKKIISSILVAAFLIFSIAMTVLVLNYNEYGVTQFGDTSIILVKEKISSEKYKKGDLVLVESKKLADIKVGDELFVYRLTDKSVVNLEVGIVGQVHENDHAISFENGDTYDIDFVAGTGNKIYNKLGTYLSIIESKWGFLFLVLVPSFLIFIYQVYALIIEIKYGEEK